MRHVVLSALTLILFANFVVGSIGAPTCDPTACEALSNSCAVRYCVPVAVGVGMVCGGNYMELGTPCSDDGNECTVGMCLDAQCLAEVAVQDGTPCSSGSCVQGQCIPDEPDIPEFTAISAGVALLGAAGFIALKRWK